MNKLRTPILLFLSLVATAIGPQLFAQASNLKVNNEKAQKRDQVKRMHPHALKLILQGKKEEAIAYLEAVSEKEVNPGQNKMLLDIARGKPGAWKFDAETWPWERTLPDTSLKQDAPSDKFTIAFGGGAGYVPKNERIWDTIGAIDPRALLLLGDNAYIDDPATPEMQLFHYYRRQSQPEWSKLAKKVPIYAIWDDHDYGSNDAGKEYAKKEESKENMRLRPTNRGNQKVEKTQDPVVSMDELAGAYGVTEDFDLAVPAHGVAEGMADTEASGKGLEAGVGHFVDVADGAVGYGADTA